MLTRLRRLLRLCTSLRSTANSQGRNRSGSRSWSSRCAAITKKETGWDSLPNDILQTVVSYFTPTERLQFALVSKSAVRAVEDLCKRKLTAIQSKHGVDHAFEKRMQALGKAQKPFRAMLWGAMRFALCRVTDEDLNGLRRRHGRSISFYNSFSKVVGDSTLAIKNNGAVGLWDLEKGQNLGTLQIFGPASHSCVNIDSTFFVGSKLVVCTYRKITVWSQAAAPAPHWKLDFEHGASSLPLLHATVGGPNDHTLISAKQVGWTEESARVQIETINVHNGAILSSFMVNAKKYGFQHGVRNVELVLCQSRWLVILFDAMGWHPSGMLVIDLLDRPRPVQYLEGDYYNLRVSKSAEGTTTIYSLNGKCNCVCLLDLDNRNGRLTDRGSFPVCTHHGYNHFSVASDSGLVVVGDYYRCSIYNAKTQELVRKLRVEGTICDSVACPALGEVLVTPSGGLPFAYCLEEPQL